jgi:ribosomal protein S18 acetylase RimI-like enzyme
LSKFLLTTTNTGVAAQIAWLLNLGGQLAYAQTEQTVLKSHITYVVEMYGEKVAGVIGLEFKGHTTELKHLCVHPDFRCKGIGIKLLQKGFDYAETKTVYGTVRSDNLSNIRNNLRLGFKPICKHLGRHGRTILIFAKRK